mgnify:CR=1 FL=1
MKYYITIARSILICFTALTWLGRCEASAEQFNEAFFKKQDPFDRIWLSLKEDGSYAVLTGGDVHDEISDYGTWEQTSNDDLLLHSQSKIRNIAAGALIVPLKDLNYAGTVLPRLGAAVSAFLSNNVAATTFSRTEIEGIFQINYRSMEDPFCLPAIDVRASIDTVPRDDLDQLLNIIQSYMNDDEKNVIRFSVRQTCGLTVLVRPDSPNSSDYRLEKITAKLNQSDSEESRSGFYYMIDSDQYQADVAPIQSNISPDNAGE